MRSWWIVGLDTGIAWPHERQQVNYLGRKVLILPFDEYTSPTIAVAYNEPWPADPVFGYEDELGEPRCVDEHEARVVTRRFLSALAWVYRTHVRETLACGCGALQAAGREGGAPYTKQFRPLHAEYLPVANSDEQRLALGYFREGLSLNSPPYAFLAFSKILNLGGGGTFQQKWISKHIDEINGLTHISTVIAQVRLKELRTEDRFKAALSPGHYIYDGCRCAIAHAQVPGRRIDPDDPRDEHRLWEDLPIIRALAEIYMRRELEIRTPDDLATDGAN